MPAFKFDCDERQRPILAIEISSSVEGVGDSIKISARIDTGADYIVISEDMVSKLQLNPLSPIPMTIANGESCVCMLYTANVKLELPDHFYDCGNMIVVAMPQNTPQYLIGLNFLSKTIFTYDGHKAQFTLEFPD